MASDFSMRTSQGRCPPFIVAGLLLICAILGFNYWSVTSQSYELLKQIEELQDQVKLSHFKRDNSEKVNSALKQRLHQYEEDIARVKISSDKKGQELQDVKQKFQEKDYEITSMKGEVQTLKEQVKSLKSNLETKLKELMAKDREVKTSVDAAAALTKQVNDLKSAATAKEEEVKALKQQVAQLEGEVKSLKADKIKVPAAAASPAKAGNTPVKVTPAKTTKPSNKASVTTATSTKKKGKAKREVEDHGNQAPAEGDKNVIEVPQVANGNRDAAVDDKDENIKNNYDTNYKEQDDEGNNGNETNDQNGQIKVSNDNLDKMAKNLQEDQEGLNEQGKKAGMGGSEVANAVDVPGVVEMPNEV